MHSKAGFSRLIATFVLLAIFVSQVPVLACPTCGCSELCPITMMDSKSGEQKGSLLSNSIWGNMILKMAYQHDSELQRLAKKLKLADFGSTAGLAAVSGGTMVQGVVAMQTLNPDPGLEDSYTPGIIGVCLEGAVLMIFSGGPLLIYKYRHELRARQNVIKEKVEVILHHLEHSETKCSEAQKELAELIGDRGARECIGLWQSSHQVAVPSGKQKTE